MQHSKKDDLSRHFLSLNYLPQHGILKYFYTKNRAWHLKIYLLSISLPGSAVYILIFIFTKIVVSDIS